MECCQKQFGNSLHLQDCLLPGSPGGGLTPAAQQPGSHQAEPKQSPVQELCSARGSGSLELLPKVGVTKVPMLLPSPDLQKGPSEGDMVVWTQETPLALLVEPSQSQGPLLSTDPCLGSVWGQHRQEPSEEAIWVGMVQTCRHGDFLWLSVSVQSSPIHLHS